VQARQGRRRRKTWRTRATKAKAKRRPSQPSWCLGECMRHARRVCARAGCDERLNPKEMLDARDVQNKRPPLSQHARHGCQCVRACVRLSRYCSLFLSFDCWLRTAGCRLPTDHGLHTVAPLHLLCPPWSHHPLPAPLFLAFPPGPPTTPCHGWRSAACARSPITVSVAV
jgi:hypothetical protein